ncbi:ribonuclease Y [Candidatus Gracilibacteria bacterium]|nr:ribonuclease Y [Candidatus Gracilibacteria bacterium]
MSILYSPIGLILTLIIGGIIGGGLIYFFILQKQKSNATKIVDDAHKEAKNILDRAQSTVNDLKKEIRESRDDLKSEKQNLVNQEKKLEEKQQKIDEKYDELDKKRTQLIKKEEELAQENKKIQEIQEKLATKLEEIAGLSKDEAKAELLETIENQYENDIAQRIEKKKKDYKSREKELTRELLINSMQQYAGEVTAETTQSIVQLESDDLKGKLIGKEGRNIIAFEKETGVSLIIDDTPDTVFISSFDLFRRYIAKKSLEDLIADKRIQPARIEEIVSQNKEDAEKLIYDLGRKTVDEIGVIGVPDEMLSLIGKSRFRTSYGQNLLLHSKEVAYISRAMAKLLGADEQLAFRGGFLHDIGKAMDHDIEGTHPEIGGRIARKYGVDEQTINIIESHHDDIPMTCIEAKIVQTADAISAVRPGARRMNAEDYIKRIQEMENIAMSAAGVDKAYALSAGREVRVFVDANTVSDLDAQKKAQEIAAQIEANCSYPGEVKVNLLRETRVIEYAK